MKPIFQTQLVSLSKIVIFCIFCVFLTCCKKTKDCPGFPPDVAEYFPYHLSDSLIFVNQHNDTISFNVISFSITEKQTIVYNPRKCDKQECTCPFINLYFYAESANHRIQVNFNIFSKENNAYLTIYFDKISFNKTLTLVELNGNTIEILKNSEKQIYKLVIVCGEGITEIYDPINNLQWKSIKK